MSIECVLNDCSMHHMTHTINKSISILSHFRRRFPTLKLHVRISAAPLLSFCLSLPAILVKYTQTYTKNQLDLCTNMDTHRTSGCAPHFIDTSWAPAPYLLLRCDLCTLATTRIYSFFLSSDSKKNARSDQKIFQWICKVLTVSN